MIPLKISGLSRLGNLFKERISSSFRQAV